MSAFEPQPPSEPQVDMPDFMVVLRGYDRRQVEAWGRELANQIEQERQRADAAEKALYRRQMEGSSPPSFSHLGAHVASIIEEAGKSAENMLADAADRAQEAVDAAEGEAAEIIKASEHRAGEIEAEARQIGEQHRAEGERVETEAREAAEEMRAQAEQDARTVLEEARDATDLIWQDAERERLAVEGETRRLETLRSRAYEQLGRMYGHLESVLDEVRRGIGIEPPDAADEDEPEPEEEPEPAAPAAAAQPPTGADTLSATRPETPTAAPAEPPAGSGGAGATQPTLGQADRAGGPGVGASDATQRIEPAKERDGNGGRPSSEPKA